MQVTVRVWLNPPVVYPAAVGDRLDVQKALPRVPRRLAVQEKSRNGGLLLSHCTKSKPNAFASMVCRLAMDTV
jgi:hypothetical protein